MYGKRYHQQNDVLKTDVENKKIYIIVTHIIKDMLHNVHTRPPQPPKADSAQRKPAYVYERTKETVPLVSSLVKQ